MNNKKLQNPCSKVVKRLEPPPPLPSLESMLMSRIFNPVEFNTERKRIVTNPNPHGIIQEKREGMRINSHGAIERIKEETLFIQTLADGNAINDNGFVRCQSCKKIVNVESIKRCPCGKTCCISNKCGCYSKKNDQWYCSKKHALLEKIKINLSWIS